MTTSFLAGCDDNLLDQNFVIACTSTGRVIQGVLYVYAATDLASFTAACNEVLLTAQPYEILLVQVAAEFPQRPVLGNVPESQRAVCGCRNQFLVVHVGHVAHSLPVPCCVIRFFKVLSDEPSN